MATIDVFGIGNPLIDICANVSEEFLKQAGLDKDRMYLVDQETQQALLLKLVEEEANLIYAPGGSCANTIVGLAQLGSKTAFTGKLGVDKHGEIYKEKLYAAKIQSHLGESQGVTGSSLVLVAPDGARTMNTYLGMCQSLAASNIPEAKLADSKVLYFTAYLWDTDMQKAAVRHALNIAKQHQVRTAISLSDPFCVNRHQLELKTLIKNDVDLVFCNQEEAFALTGTQSSQEALSQLAKMCQTVVLTMGAHGALIAHDGKVTYIDSVPTTVVDTTGAGDAFAAGFLYGMTCGKPYLESGNLAALMASKVISHMGPRLTPQQIEEVIQAS